MIINILKPMTRRYRWFFLFFVCLSTSVAAQPLAPNVKFGNPTKEELAMTTYDPDPEAAAVKLCGTQDVYYDILKNNFVIVYEIKKRIKVLKPEGTDEANISIVYTNHEVVGKPQEEITNIKATAYNLENGQVVKTKMKSEQVFDDRVDKDHKIKKFTIPQVKVGTVLEYEYKLLSEYYYTVKDWYAQSAIPTLYTSYTLTIPEWFLFNIEQTGWEHLDNHQKERDFKFSIHGNLLPCNATEYTFSGQQLPAIHPDRFVWCLSDYATKVRTELSQVAVPGAYVKTFALTWDDVIKQVKDDSDFGGRLKRKNPLQQEVSEAGIRSQTDAQEKLLSTIGLLHSRMRWNNRYDLFGSDHALRDGTGSNADMNFLLIQMLKDVGIEAFPVLLRKRDSGRLPQTHPTLQSFNTFIVGVPLTEEKVVYVDASSVNSYLNVLPSDLLVDAAYAMRENDAEKWVNLQEINKGRTSTFIEAVVAADGSVSGTAKSSHNQNAALVFCEDFKSAKDSATYVKDIAEKNHIEIVKYQLQGHQGFQPEVIETTVFTKEGENNNGRIYLNPWLFPPMDESPFTDEERHLPVELPFVQTETIHVRLTLPEGYVIEEKPQNFALRMEDGGGMCRILCDTQDDVFSMQYTFTLNKLYFSPEDYVGLKSFFDLVVQHLGEMLILKKAS